MPRIGKTACINCGATMDGVSCVEGEEETNEKRQVVRRKFDLNEDKMPEPGNAVVCMLCGHIMAFDENLQLRELTEAEQIAIAGNPAMLIVQRARGDFIKKHPDYFEKLKDQTKK